MAACCIFISNRRAQERVGDSVVFPYAKNALVFILSVCGSLSIGFILHEMFLSATAMYIALAIGFFIAYCIAQMIAAMTFKILNKMKDLTKFGAIAVGILLLVIVLTSADILGYERYVPHFADIEGVQMLDVDILSRNLGKPTNAALSELLIKDTEIIKEAITLHQTIVNERQSIRQFHFDQLLRRPIVSLFLGQSRPSFSLLYKLKNGDLIVRRYYLPESFMDENDVHRLRARSRLSLLQNRPDLIDGIQLTFYDPVHSVIYIDKPEHIQEFIYALMNDHDLIQPIRFAQDAILVSFRAKALDLDNYWLNSLSFEIVYNERGYVRDWLRENGYELS